MFLLESALPTFVSPRRIAVVASPMRRQSRQLWYSKKRVVALTLSYSRPLQLKGVVLRSPSHWSPCRATALQGKANAGQTPSPWEELRVIAALQLLVLFEIGMCSQGFLRSWCFCLVYVCISVAIVCALVCVRVCVRPAY